MDTSVIQATASQTKAGAIAFPEVVRQLLAAGVASYQVDLLRDEVRYYGTGDASHVEPLGLAHGPVASGYDQPGVLAAVRAAQTEGLPYPRFIERILAAGSTGYTAYLTGRKVVYLGREGQAHTEHFPA